MVFADLMHDFFGKYLLTITGYAAFKILIPIALLFVIIRIYWPKDILVKLALKLGLFGLFLFATVPASVFVSDLIEKHIRLHWMPQ